MIRKRPKDGTIRRKRAFAWLPVRTDDGYRLWFEYYTRVERYCGFNDMWVLPKRLSRGIKVRTNNGDKSWFLNGKLHREDGPAVEWSDGSKFWYLNHKRHREDGPAIVWANGNKCWFLNDERLTEEEHKEAMTPTVEMTMAQINEALGKNVKVVK